MFNSLSLFVKNTLRVISSMGFKVKNNPIEIVETTQIPGYVSRDAFTILQETMRDIKTLILEQSGEFQEYENFMRVKQLKKTLESDYTKKLMGHQELLELKELFDELKKLQEDTYYNKVDTTKDSQVLLFIMDIPKTESGSKFSKVREFFKGLGSIFDLSGTYYNNEIEETIKEMSPDRIIGLVTKNIRQSFDNVCIKLEMGNVSGSRKQII